MLKSALGMRITDKVNGCHQCSAERLSGPYSCASNLGLKLGPTVFYE